MHRDAVAHEELRMAGLMPSQRQDSFAASFVSPRVVKKACFEYLASEGPALFEGLWQRSPAAVTDALAGTTMPVLEVMMELPHMQHDAGTADASQSSGIAAGGRMPLFSTEQKGRSWNVPPRYERLQRNRRFQRTETRGMSARELWGNHHHAAPPNDAPPPDELESVFPLISFDDLRRCPPLVTAARISALTECPSEIQSCAVVDPAWTQKLEEHARAVIASQALGHDATAPLLAELNLDLCDVTSTLFLCWCRCGVANRIIFSDAVVLQRRSAVEDLLRNVACRLSVSPQGASADTSRRLQTRGSQDDVHPAVVPFPVNYVVERMHKLQSEPSSQAFDALRDRLDHSQMQLYKASATHVGVSELDPAIEADFAQSHWDVDQVVNDEMRQAKCLLNIIADQQVRLQMELTDHHRLVSFLPSPAEDRAGLPRPAAARESATEVSPRLRRDGNAAAWRSHPSEVHGAVAHWKHDGSYQPVWLRSTMKSRVAPLLAADPHPQHSLVPPADADETDELTITSGDVAEEFLLPHRRVRLAELGRHVALPPSVFVNSPLNRADVEVPKKEQRKPVAFIHNLQSYPAMTLKTPQGSFEPGAAVWRTDGSDVPSAFPDAGIVQSSKAEPILDKSDPSPPGSAVPSVPLRVVLQSLQHELGSLERDALALSGATMEHQRDILEYRASMRQQIDAAQTIVASVASRVERVTATVHLLGINSALNT